MKISEQMVWQRLEKVMDPELSIDIVSLGLVYTVSVREVQATEGLKTQIHILMTLTTPGCPLSHLFEKMVKDALADLPDIDVYRNVTLELTFDPPWIPDMMSPEARAELGF